MTLAPVLLSFFMKGKFKTEDQNPINRGLERVYAPLINWCLTWRKTYHRYQPGPAAGEYSAAAESGYRVHAPAR